MNTPEEVNKRQKTKIFLLIIFVIIGLGLIYDLLFIE